MTSPHQRWTPEEVATLEAYWAHGHRSTSIARLMGRGVRSIEWKAEDLGLLVRPAPKSKPGITPDRTQEHAAACLREGGFPAAYVINGRTILVRPCDLEKAA